MKKFLLVFSILFAGMAGLSQITISPGTQWIADGNMVVNIQNLDFVNNGTFSPGAGSIRFSGNQNSTVTGSNVTWFNILELAKSNSANVALNKNINILSSLNFISGKLDLNGNNIIMNSGAMISGESENNRIIGTIGGFVEITTDMNAPAALNAGNLGATISSNANLGSVTIRRGHTAQSGTGLSSSMNRYYLIMPTNNSNLNATLRLKYFDGELNGQNEIALVMYKSNNNGADWNNMAQTTRNTNANYVEKTGMNNLTLQTLATDNVVLPDGPTGVVLTGQRKKPTEVTLKWSSLTETNMSGYQIQRRLRNEIDFSDRVFVNTLAAGGSSISLLSYQNIDANSYTDTSFYRLKMITNNNSFTYSNVITIPAKIKGSGNGNGNNKSDDDITMAIERPMMQTNSTAKKIIVGPNPNDGNFWFSIIGIEQETIAVLFYIDGRKVKEFNVTKHQQIRVNGLRSGLYALRVPGFETQKIIVNGNGNHVPNAHPVIENNLKF